MPINNRVFGSDIPIKVKKTLEARQLAAEKTRLPGDQINPSKYPDDRGDYYNYGELLDNEFNGVADLSSRTPFIRMWTGVQTGVYEGADDIVLYEGQTINAYDYSGTSAELEQRRKDIEEEHEEAQAFNDKAELRFPKSQVSFQKLSPTSLSGRYVVKRPAKNIDFSKPKIYMLGNHVLNTTDKITPQQQITADEYQTKSSDEQKDYITGEMFPDEHGVRNDENKFLKPAAGIVSVSSETEGALGERKTTTINFVVHNFADFDAIYNRYFLRPGAQIFIDFGWSSVKDLYDPYEIIGTNSEDGKDAEEIMIEKLYGEIQSGDSQDGVVTRSKGNLEVVIGQVTNYDSKILENGSVECSLTIQSPNVAMMTFPKLQHLKTKIDFLLDHFFRFEALNNFNLKKDKDGKIVPKSDFDSVPDSSSSVREIADFEELVDEKVEETLGGSDFNPTVLGSIAGLFLPDSKNSESQYISLGFLEDKILNAEFAFGKNIDDINDVNVKGLETKIDSSESFTFYHSEFHQKQSTIGQSGEKDPVFLIPKFWDRTYNTITKHTPFYGEGIEDFVFLETGTTIDTFNQEFNDWIATEDVEPSYFDTYPYGAPITEYDKTINGGDENSTGRIPIREIFIHSDIVKEAFGPDSKSFKDIVNHILKAINEDSYDIFKFKLAGGQDNTLKIIDENFLGVDNIIDEDVFDKLFTFNIMSPNSIVKSYNVNLSLPNDAIGANVAIQALSGTNEQVLPVNEAIINAASLADIFNTLTDNLERETGLKQEIKVKYLPDIGGFRGRALSDSNVEKQSYQDLYTTELRDSNDFYLNASYGNVINTETLFEPTDDTEDDKGDDTGDTAAGKDDRLITAMDAEQIQNGFFVTQNFQEYFRAKIAGKFVDKKNPPLPLKLELTIYGIASLVPGDIFTVDYLPKIYLKTCYFQVTKIKHNIGSDGWYTTLETVFRYRKKMSNLNAIQGRYRGFAISAHLFDSFKINDSEAYKYYREDKSFSYSKRRDNIRMFEAAYDDGEESSKNTGRGYRLGGAGGSNAGSSKSHVVNYGGFPKIYSFFRNLELKTNSDSPLGEGNTVRVVQNFADAQGYMSNIQPVAVPADFTHVSQIFKFTVRCPKDEGIILISPMYFSNTGTDLLAGETAEKFKNYDFHNGYGGRNFPLLMTGLYYNQEEVFLIFNSDDPQRFYGFIPKINYDETDPELPGSSKYFKGDFTSVTTPDFLNYFGTKTGIDKTSGEVDSFNKRYDSLGETYETN